MPDAQHERFMKRCIELAKIAAANNNTAVGSLITLDSEIVSEGIEEMPQGRSLTGHAELLACQAALESVGLQQLRQSTLYTTAEPCFMCSYVIRQCEIPLVVFGAKTSLIGGVTSANPVLTDTALSNWKPAPQVIGGILEPECRMLRPAAKRDPSDY